VKFLPIAALPSCHGVQFQRSIHGLSAITSELGKSVAPASDPPPITGCPSCLLRMSIRMEKRGRWTGGRRGSLSGGITCVEKGGSQGKRRNVHESFWFYCTFSIILRNSSKSSMPSAFLSPSFISSSISSSVMASPVLRMMRENSSLSM